MAVTTLKLQESTKSELDEFKSENESYDKVIKKLVFIVRYKNLKNQLIEAYQKMGKKDLEILDEWEPASQEL
ncbi:Uncharacterised protein [uncultured archaeon]|nr:Uncharacterised protein [uncultured archaeon]